MKNKDVPTKNRSKSHQRPAQIDNQFTTHEAAQMEIRAKQQHQIAAALGTNVNRQNKKLNQQFQNLTGLRPGGNQRNLSNGGNTSYQFAQQQYDAAILQQIQQQQAIQATTQANPINYKANAVPHQKQNSGKQVRLRNNSSGNHLTQMQGNQQYINEMGRVANIDEINNILAAQTAAAHPSSVLDMYQQQNYVLSQENSQAGIDQNTGLLGPSPDKVIQKKNPQNAVRKHSSVKRNQINNTQENATLQHQQWMNQTLPSNMMVNKVEGGGSGGSGGCSGSQDQINQQSTDIHLKQQFQTVNKGSSPYGHEQQVFYGQQTHYSNVKNRLPIDQIQQIRATRNMTKQELLNPSGFTGSVTGSGPTYLAMHPQQQLLLQQQNLPNASSDIQIPTLPKTQSTTKEGKKAGNNASNRGLFGAVQQVLGNQGSKQRIQNRSGSNATQQTAGASKKGAPVGITPANLTNSVTHQTQKAPSALNSHTKGKQGSGQLNENSKQKQDSSSFLDTNLMTPGSIVQQQNHFNIQQQSNGRKTQLQTINPADAMVPNAGQKGSRQSSKLRKNVPTVRNQNQGVSSTLGKNGQRVSQQRRFNNTTLDNYSQHMQQTQLNTINQINPGNQSGIVQHQQFDPNGPRTLIPQNVAAPGQQRSALRQNQQQKQYLNNFIPSNKFASNKNQDAASMRIKNQEFLNKHGGEAPRAQSTLKPAGPTAAQNFKGPLHHLVSGQTTKNLSNAQFNNYLVQQQQQIENLVGGQSPLLKQNNLALIHKRSESVTNQRPPHQEAIPQKQATIENNAHTGKIYYQKTQNIPMTKIQYNTKQQHSKQPTIDQTNAIDMNVTQKTQSIKATKKSDSEQSAQSGGNFEQNQNSAGGGLQMRRNQPHNFSNVSEKSSIMGDYGGTHTTMHNVNPSLKKSKQGGLPSNGGSQDAAQQQKFFSNRNANAAGANTTSNSAATQGSAVGTNSSLVQGDAGNQFLVSNQKNRSNVSRRGQQVAGHGGMRGAAALGSQESQEDIDDMPIQMPGANMAGSQKSSSQAKNRNAMNKYQTQIIAMPDLNSTSTGANSNQRGAANPGSGTGNQPIMAAGPANGALSSNNTFQKSSANSNKRTSSRQNNRRIVISQKQQEQQQFMTQQQQKPNTLNQAPLQTLQTLHMKQPQLKNVIKAAAKGSAAATGINQNQKSQIQGAKATHQKGMSTGIAQPQNRIVPLAQQHVRNNTRVGGHLLQEPSGANASALAAADLTALSPPGRSRAPGDDVDEAGDLAEELAQSTMGEEHPTAVHITSDEFHDHDEEEGDEEEDADEVDEEHDYELGTGINDILLRQANEVEYEGTNVDFINQQHLLQQQLNQINLDQSADETKRAPSRAGEKPAKATTPAQQIGKQDLIMIKNRNVYIQQDDADDENLEAAPAIPLVSVKNGGNDSNSMKIVIQDNSALQAPSEEGKKEDAKGDSKAINYETFESSSEDEFSQGAFESAAASFQNKEKNVEQCGSGFQEHKRQERQRRKERKHMEKKKVKAEQDRERRNVMRKKYRLQSQGIEHYDEYQDDMLNFKDSDRESVISYFEQFAQDKVQIFQKYDDHRISGNLIDTPTRLVNHSNEFLPEKKKINPDKLAKKGNLLMYNDIKAFKDIEDQFSDIEKSQKSTFRKLEDDKKDMLFKIVSSNEIEKLQLDIQRQMGKMNTNNSVDQGSSKKKTGEGIHFASKMRGSMGVQKNTRLPTMQDKTKQPKRY